MEKYLRVEGALDLHFVLLLRLLFFFLLRLQKFQIFLRVLLVLFGDESASRGGYSFGVLTFPSTTTT